MSIDNRGDACVWLSGVAWEDYVRLRDIPESRNVRMTYDEGRSNPKYPAAFR